MKEQSLPKAVSSHLTPLDFSNPGMGMPPATSSPVLRRRRDEGDTATIPRAAPTDPRTAWRDAFRAVRAETERRAAPLSAEDQVVQSMPDASPTKWHRAHTAWFFEQFLLLPHLVGYRVFDERFAYLFNSYYVAAGPRHARPQRGLVMRPDCERAAAFRAHVDAGVERLLAGADDSQLAEVVRILEIGLHHEQQHQELILTDILNAFAQNPVTPSYEADWRAPAASSASGGFVALPSGTHGIGFEGEGYCFDNERPAHRVLLQPACIGRGLVTNAQWLEFMAEGGYATPSLWLSDGWATVEAEGWNAPGYWRKRDGAWYSLTLGGLRPVDPDAAVAHVSYYEADAFARELSQFLLSVGALAVQRAETLGLCGMNARADARRPELKMAAQIQAALRDEGAEAGSSFARDVIAGLTARPKRLSPKYFYDEIGAQLFEDITALPEYYLTRCELEILRERAADIARFFPADSALIEFGSGSSKKVRILLAAAPTIAAYVPVDISSQMLVQEAEALRRDYPRLAVLPVEADFTQPFSLPAAAAGMAHTGFFPGSTIGNFEPHEASSFLRHAGRMLGRGAALIIGVDLVKDASMLNAAYDDAAGLTAKFNLNLLARINRELNGDFELENFGHCAFYNRERHRIEMHLVSKKRQKVSVAGRSVEFRAGETIHTENSYKYTLEYFTALARGSGWTPAATWTDAGANFSIHALTFEDR